MTDKNIRIDTHHHIIAPAPVAAMAAIARGNALKLFPRLSR